MFLGTTTCEIDLANTYRLRAVKEIEIKKSVHQIVQTAKVTLPLSVVIRNQNNLQNIKLTDKIKEGDTIKLSFGYDGNNRTEFVGYIRNINYKIPVVLECEDNMYLFRQTNIDKSWKRDSLKNILNDILNLVYQAQGYRLQLLDSVPDVTVENLICKDQTALWLLQTIIDRYPLFGIFIVDDNGVEKLYCGLLYGRNVGEVNYMLESNCKEGDLTYKKDVNPTKVIIETVDKRGRIERTVFGDTHAKNTIKRRIPGEVSELAKKQAAQEELNRKTYEGYRGNINAFLKPYIEPGMIANIGSKQFPDRAGKYYIGTVTTTFGTNGGKRKPQIEFKTSA
ncbi:MAG: hypothetical protein DI598_20345 [Pseudopedobacter saltans]|uniref:Uncharacterized protein n=1 Tax=Pseudopedobacter saltans TaxID=151895 RepID=A0A2W5G6G3_9SPHI|nr:MAG: hypothetical protein DI598_20345 [Pseudopedobacter saltans]